VVVLVLADGAVVVRSACLGPSAGRVFAAEQRGAPATTGAEVSQRTAPTATTAPGRAPEKRPEETEHRTVLDRRPRRGIG